MNRQDIKQNAIWWVDLNPTRGTEQRGHRPYLVVSVNEINQHVPRVIVVPLTSQPKTYPTAVRLNSTLEKTGKVSYALTDQIRAVAVERFTKYIGEIEPTEVYEVQKTLAYALGLE